MLRTLSALAALCVAATGCNCGRQTVTMTEASLTLPLDVLEFGVVAEGTSKGGKFRVDNVGRAAVNVSVAVSEGSPDFALGTVPTTVEAGGFIEVPVTFTPEGAGEDVAFVEVKTVGTMEIPLTVRLHGGPIAPALGFDPDPLDFRPATMPLERKTVQLKSVGTSALTIRSVGVSAAGNPQFSVLPATLPMRLLPGESLGVRVEYARNGLTTEGLLEVLSDDADAGLRVLRLLPDRAAQCADGLDNDGDNLVDFPDDPGCQDAQDDDETNSAACVNGGTQPCNCGGVRTCVNGAYGMCMGGTGCDAGVDAGVDAGFDAGVDAGVDAGAPCSAVGTYLLNVDGGFPVYSCCEFFGTPLVNLEIDTVVIQTGGTVSRPTPTQPGSPATLTGPAAVCPGGSFVHRRVIPGGCQETYTLTGQFVSGNTFVGTYTAQFSGADCTGGGAGLCGTPCLNQSWNISATR